MGLDFYVMTADRGKIHISMSEGLHLNIFTNGTQWINLKTLRKIRDYYKTDELFKGKDANFLIADLIAMSGRLPSDSEKLSELNELIGTLSKEKISWIRVAGD